MDVIHFPEDARPPRWSQPVLALGNFDGVHRGHRKILERVCRVAGERGGTSVVMTFDPHPPRVVRPVWRRPAWLSVAAALLLLLGTRIALRLVHPNTPPVPGSVVAPAGMDVNDLSPGQLREVLRTIDQPVDDGMGPADVGLEDLSTPELRRLLRALEG